MAADYDVFARFYDLDYADVDDDLLFWRELARAVSGPVLEIGCGTGRVLAALAEAGGPVTGVDVSAAMLERARARLGDQARLVQADIRALRLPERYGLIAWSADTFLLLDTAEDQQRALAVCAQHLAPDGRLVIDCFNAFASGNLEGSNELILAWVRPDPATGEWVSKSVARASDPASQRQVITFFYDVTGPDGRLTRTIAPFAFRFVFAAELALRVERAGLSVEQIYGGYDLEPYATSSERLIMVATRTAT